MGYISQVEECELLSAYGISDKVIRQLNPDEIVIIAKMLGACVL